MKFNFKKVNGEIFEAVVNEDVISHNYGADPIACRVTLKEKDDKISRVVFLPPAEKFVVVTAHMHIHSFSVTATEAKWVTAIGNVDDYILAAFKDKLVLASKEIYDDDEPDILIFDVNTTVVTLIDMHMSGEIKSIKPNDTHIKVTLVDGTSAVVMPAALTLTGKP